MDKRYGDQCDKLEFTREAERMCVDILRKFAYRLHDLPSVMGDYHKMRELVLE